MNWHSTVCERCGEKREIAWVVFSNIIQDFVCDACGQAALEIRRKQGYDFTLPGSIRVVSYRSEHYAQ